MASSRNMPINLYSVEGNTQRLDGGAMFGNAPRALWQRWLEPDERHRIPLACRGLLAEKLNGKRVLFETGIGAFFAPNMRDRYGVVEEGHVLLESLKERGTSHEEIDVVVLSHLHFDHAGGLLTPYEDDKEYELLFPKAVFVVGKKAWERSLNPHPRDKASFIPQLNELLKASGRLELVEGEHSQALGESVRFHYSDGHTPGLMLGEIVGADDGNSVGKGIVFCGDLMPGVAWVHVPITMGYDRYPELLIDEKQAFLDDMLARGVRLFFTHDPQWVAASVGQDERGRYMAVDKVAQLDGS